MNKTFEIRNLILNSQDFFDIKTLFGRAESDPVVSRLLYSATINTSVKGAMNKTNETDKELYPIFSFFEWKEQDEVYGGDIMNSFRTLFNLAIRKSPNKNMVYKKLSDLNGFDKDAGLPEQYELVVPCYSEFNWINENLELFIQYSRLIDTMGNIMVWERKFNEERGKSSAIKDRFDLSLKEYKNRHFVNKETEWEKFIISNQLQDYVDENSEVLIFSDNISPKSSRELGEYLSWVIPKMIGRNERILKYLES